MSHEYVAAFVHRGLGPMIRLTIIEGYSFDLTYQEAQILSRALAAVKAKTSSVEDVYEPYRERWRFFRQGFA